MNKRYSDMLLKIQSMNKQGQDENLMQGLYNLIYPQQSGRVDRSEDLKKGTKYSNLSNEKFMDLFGKQVFNYHSDDNIKHLFQELHNRYLTNKGYDVTRNVVVGSDKNHPKALGYVTAMNDMLFINKDAIEKAKLSEIRNSMNKDNLGLVMNYVITHESQHICQFESAVDFVLGNEQDKETKFLGALTAIEQANIAAASRKFDLLYVRKWKKNYKNHYIEHNANYSAFKSVNENLTKEQKSTDEYRQFSQYTGILGLRGFPVLSTPEKFLNKRLNGVEDFTRYEIEYFKKRVADCPLKEEILKTVDEYMKIDEFGNSDFRKNVFGEMKKMFQSTFSAMIVNPKNENKDNINQI